MTGRLKLIEQQLIGIDSAAFQNLCDIYLSYKQKELASFGRTGSQLGKQKTVKGTPDTYYRLSNGNLSYVECTTTHKGLIKKLKSDIDKCLDESITGIPPDSIHEIILCFNSRLSIAQESEITQYAKSKHIRIELIGVDFLALEIYSKHPLIAKDLLGLQVDTGQVLTLKEFINEYNNKGGSLSTPIDNEFLYRKIELGDINNALNTSDILIMSGAAGIGKTKIALEALEIFSEENNSYQAYAISKKDIDIWEDLRTHLQTDKNYLILIDDANRQLLNLKQLLGIFKEPRKGVIKLVITVRNYALNDIRNECSEFNTKEILLKKFTDDEIKGIISSESFEVKNHIYQSKIKTLADGNARIAIMAARLAKEKNYEFLTGDMYDMYDFYFKTFIKDFDTLQNRALLKTLGIISFFFTIDRTDRAFIEALLQNFEIDYHEFNECIEELQKRELVEIQYNNVKISEQVMATYFFYLVFIKDQMLSFENLLFKYFPIYYERFNDSIIPANNTFQYDNVLGKIDNTLNKYIVEAKNDEARITSFFSLFWFYKGSEILAFYFEKITALPESENQTFISKYNDSNPSFGNDKILKMLSNYFDHHTEHFTPSIELAFEYARKRPEVFPELIKHLRSSLQIDYEDQQYGFSRQTELLNILIAHHANSESHYSVALFALCETLLAHRYSISKSGGKNTISLYQYAVPSDSTILSLRTRIWETLFDAYKTHKEEVYEIIYNYKNLLSEPSIEILKHDLTYLIPFFEEHIDPAIFKNAYCIQELIIMLDRNKGIGLNYKNIKNRFNTKEYEYFRKLDWNFRRGKLDYEYSDYEQFRKLKERDIRKEFVFKNHSDFEYFHIAIRNILSIKDNSIHGIDESLNIVVEENFNINNELGFSLIESILNDYRPELNILGKAITVVVNKSEGWAIRLWNLLCAWENDYALYLKLQFLALLPEKFVNEYYTIEFFKVIKSIDKNCYIHLDSFSKFSKNDKNVVEKVLKIIVSKIRQNKYRLTLPYGFFDGTTVDRIENLSLLFESYLQQESLQQHFDYKRKGLYKLVLRDSSLLKKYVESSFKEDKGINQKYHEIFSFVWEIKNHQEILDDCFTYIIENYDYYGILEHPINAFFNSLNDDSKVKCKNFILKFISKYSDDRKKMEAIFDVIRHSIKDLTEEAMLVYLKANPSIDDFRKISWRGNGGVYSGDVIIGDIHAREWERILEIVIKAEDQLKMIPIKNYIKKQIAYEYESGEYERKMKFVSPRGY